MVATIAQIIGKINPKIYAENGKELLRKYKSAENIPADEVEPKPAGEHALYYDSSSETLEPIYFYILDLINDFDFETEKLIDNFTTSPGSGHFSEMGQRATIMQQQGTKLLGDINTVLRSVLNIIYDLKDFKIRLSQYDDLKTPHKEAATLALKQIWMDKVDITKGNSSIKAMGLGQAGFQTLIDAFLFVKEVKDANKVDLNDRVKRILMARILEFNTWLKHSEGELRKRYELERNYLKSQVNSLKLYSRWAKPYLRAASELEMGVGGTRPELVKAFNTVLLELSLIGKKKIKVKEEAIAGNLPKDFEKIKTRDFFICVLVDFKFRGIPQRITQQPNYVFGGRAEVTFKAYALSEDELDKLKKELEESDLGDVLKLIEGSTGESLKEMQKEIDFFLDEQEKSEGPKDKSNPFTALVGGYGRAEKKAAGKTKGKGNVKPKRIKPETYPERKVIRVYTEDKAKELTFKFFDIYKKSHGMASYT